MVRSATFFTSLSPQVTHPTYAYCVHTMDKITDATFYMKQNTAEQCSNTSRV